MRAEKYFSFIPNFLPKAIINYSAGLLELILGIGVFIPRFKSGAIFGIFLLMIVFLPLHVMDIFKEKPMIGNHLIAVLRLPIQFILIGWAWVIYKK